MRFPAFWLLFFMGIFAVSAPARAVDTDLTISVLAHDGTFIGSAAGGVSIIIRDKRTGDIIANGTTAGTSGDQKTLMSGTRARDALLTTDDSARLELTLDLLEPVPVTISATGPLAQPQSMVTASFDTVLIPGKDYTSGNGILIELPGLSVDVLNPPVNTSIPFDPNTPVTVVANVMKLCPCLIAADSPWPPERYEVQLHVYKDLRYITAAPMQYAGSPGQFIANLKLPQPGGYKFLVTAFDSKTKEVGMDATTVTLVAPPQDQGTKPKTEKAK